jgi:predicted nucleic acid-binding protein
VTLVVDASVAIKWYFREPLHEAAVALLRAKEPLHAPDLIAIEVANVAWVKSRKREIKAEQAHAIADDIGITIDRLEPSFPLVERALEIAFALDHSIYDSLYIACAEAIGGTLITADERLCKATKGSRFAALVRPLRDHRS